MLHNKHNTILLYGPVDEKMAHYFTREMISMARYKNVIIRINSFGGDLLCALAIINVMRSHRGNIITVVDGAAASAASLIAASGTCRLMHRNSFHLVHKVVNDCPINAPMFNAVINRVYKGVDLPEDKWMTASESFEMRLCDKLI